MSRQGEPESFEWNPAPSRPSPWDYVEGFEDRRPKQWSSEQFHAESVSCARCSGGAGMLCDQCTIEVTVAALDTVRETNWPDPGTRDAAP